VKLQAIAGHRLFRPAVGAALAVLCGLLLWGTRLGDAWENASYDYLFLFAARVLPETNKVVLVLMDDVAYRELGQKRGQPWDRRRHADLLNKLADDDCRMVVFDVFLEQPGDAEVDKALAAAMQRQGRVILAARFLEEQRQELTVRKPGLHELFLGAAFGWGYADAGVNELHTPRWEPFIAPKGSQRLPKIAAEVAGARASETTQPRWLRYYGVNGGWKHCNYHQAFSQPPGYFHNKIVFVGSDPERKNNPNFYKDDKFHAPHTRWTGESVGGVEIMATTFLNLMNGDWLRRPAWWVEGLMLVLTGVLLGGSLGQVRSSVAWWIAAGATLGVTLGGVCLSYYTNYWFPWLVIVGGQMPCALAWSVLSTVRREAEVPAKAIGPTGTVLLAELPTTPNLPDTPDYELFDPPFGEGGFGKVWLARNAIGQWQALKAVYQSKFGQATGPYEAEFKGIERYKPVSEKHPGLLRIDFVSRMKPEGYFYYVMELGDGQTADWKSNPASYKPWDLTHLRVRSNGGRVPVMDCVRIGLALTEALDFLHRQGLTHRDIKPSNVIFVNGQPKLADVGLVSDIRSPDQIHTYAGTPGYMPPPPEPPGTVVADIYALGMLLYVTSTGRDPDSFPNLSTILMERTGHSEFIRLNAIILKACQPDATRRYASAAEMYTALQETLRALENDTTRTS